MAAALRESPRAVTTARQTGGAAAVDLYWLPLGAGASVVRFNGRVYEALKARLERRTPLDLYHCALVIQVPEGRFTMELAPIPDDDGAARGVVCVGPVGSRWLGWWRLFRYELRCWRDGVIPDLDAAVASPQRLTADPERARRVLDLAPSVPTAVWGRDELRTGDMWNCNSVISWLLARSGLPVARAQTPPHGRAPGWDAGLIVARRADAGGRPDVARIPQGV